MAFSNISVEIIYRRNKALEEELNRIQIEKINAEKEVQFLNFKVQNVKRETQAEQRVLYEKERQELQRDVEALRS